MNRNFMSTFFEKTNFPAPAREYLFGLANAISKDIDEVLTFYENAYDHEATVPLIEALSQKRGCSPYSVWMIVLILAAEKARPLYKNETLYWDTFCDLRYKAQECHDVYGIWGTFVAHWYPIFYNGSIVKLGRMEYQTRPCTLKEPVTAFGITVNPGDPVLYLHIPTSFEPFDRNARVKSYQKAWKHFCPNGKPLVCICTSWLLYAQYDRVFASGSNIANFRQEFVLFKNKQTAEFGDAWRVFGKDHTLPAVHLPENTSLQRAFKAHILSGGSHGHGIGMLVFDGKNVMTEDMDSFTL